MLSRFTNTQKVAAVSAKLAKDYLQDPTNVPRSMATRALRNQVRYSQQDWFTTLSDYYIKHTDANIRGTVGRAMVFTDEENAKKVLDFALTEDVSPANTITAVYIAISGLDDLSMFYTWLEQNFVALSEKMPAYHLARMPEYLSSSCDAANIKMAEKFYADKKAQFDGMQRSYDIAIYQANQCVSMKEANQTSFNQYLKQATKS